MVVKVRIQVVAVLSTVALVAAIAAPQAQAKLPRTYQVQRVDSPAVTAGGNFGIAFVNGGDLNGDGKADLIVGTDEHGGSTGTIFEISGADGTAIRSISSPDPDGNGTKASFGSYVGSLADLGSCAGGTSGALCALAAIGAPDGTPEVLVTALGIDVGGLDDVGRAYVYDGKTGALLKRIDIPAADITTLGSAPAGQRKPAFGRTILNPSSQYGPTGVGGPTTPPVGVRIGDMNGGGAPDIVIGASDFFETGATANPASDCATSTVFNAIPANNQCLQAGRGYVYYGETIAGTDPSVIENTADLTIKNPTAQADDPNTPVNSNRESLGYSVTPVGDLGTCTTNPGPGAFCATANSTGTADGKADVVISSHRTDDFGMFDAGQALLIDGATGAELYAYRHPEPQPASLFAFSNYNQPAPGDLGSSTTPDVYEAAMRQNNPNTGGGKGFVMNGAFKQPGSPNSVSFAAFVDPTPNASEDFGTSSAGVGNVVTTADGLDDRNEYLIGAYGPHNPGTNPFVINDVHFFSALTEKPLQSIAAPDQQAGSGFGTAIAPLGDLNGDGMLDIAVGAGLYDGAAGTDQGRIYILRSDDSPAPAVTPTPLPTGPAGPVGPAGPAAPTSATALAGRTLVLAASASSVKKSAKVTLRGVLEAFANPAGCQASQDVTIQRRSPTSATYSTIAKRTTSSKGSFSASIKVSRTGVFRARIGETASCAGASSSGERVTVKKQAAKRRG